MAGPARWHGRGRLVVALIDGERETRHRAGADRLQRECGGRRGRRTTEGEVLAGAGIGVAGGRAGIGQVVLKELLHLHPLGCQVGGGLRNLAAHDVVGVGGHGDRSQYADDGHNNHQFDEREAGRRNAWGCGQVHFAMIN